VRTATETERTETKGENSQVWENNHSQSRLHKEAEVGEMAAPPRRRVWPVYRQPEGGFVCCCGAQRWRSSQRKPMVVVTAAARLSYTTPTNTIVPSNVARSSYTAGFCTREAAAKSPPHQPRDLAGIWRLPRPRRAGAHCSPPPRGAPRRPEAGQPRVIKMLRKA